MSKVVCCIDTSTAAGAVCDAGAWASARLAVPLLLLHVLEKAATLTPADLSGSLGIDSREQLLEELASLDQKRGRLAMEHGKVLLDAARQRVSVQAEGEVEVLQQHGNLVDSVRGLQDSTRLLIMGRQGAAHAGQVLGIGSQLESVIRAAQKPLLITLSHFEPPTNFLLAFDGRSVTQKVLDTVIGSPLLQGLTCHLVAVNNTHLDRGPELYAGARKLENSGFKVKTVLLRGDVQEELQGYQREVGIELLVMGAYGHSRLRRLFLGSNTTEMLSHSRVPMIIVR